MKNPSQWPIEREFSPWQRMGFALGAWFLLMLPAVVVTLMVYLLLSFVR